MSGERYFDQGQAKKIGDELGIKWDKFNVEQFRRGMDVELEHGLWEIGRASCRERG